MKMRLYIIRHAAAEQGNYHKDFQRVLREKGENQLPEMTRFLLKHRHHLMDVHLSSSRRTKDTYNGILMGLNENSVHYHETLFHASLKTLLDFIWNCGTENKDIAIIGHNPGLSDLASYFSGEDIYIRTGGIIILDFPFEKSTELSKECGEIVGRFRS